VPMHFFKQIVDMARRKQLYFIILITSTLIFAYVVDESLTGNNTDAFGRSAAPLEILILGVLRVLARRWTFDDLYEASYISAEVHRRFFHKFVHFYAKNVYPEVCRPPETDEEIQSCTKDYEVHTQHLLYSS